MNMHTGVKTQVLDHGYVQLYDYMGDDLRIVNNARQSFGQESESMTEKEVGLIKFLMRNRHGTPFEHVVFTFNIKCPIFVAREWMRHRIGSYNEYSGRYSKMISDFYIPDNVRSQVGKPGSYKFEPLPENLVSLVQNDMGTVCEQTWAKYETYLKMGVAKEVARMVLPVNIYTSFTWTVNLRALFNFISLRSAENAMWEIRQYSQTIEKAIRPTVPVAYDAFVKSGRITP